MYQILIDGELFCDSRVDDLAIINPVVKLEANKAGSFTFVIPPNHPFFDLLTERVSLVSVYRDEETEPTFAGICTEYTDDFYGQRSVVCEGELTFFNDTIQRPYHYDGVTAENLLKAYIANHNASADSSKQFVVGDVTVTDSNNAIYCYTNYNSTMTEIKEDLIDDLGGYLRIRHQNGQRIIDYLKESPHSCSQVIRLGENLLDFESNLDTTEVATVVIPLGATLETQEISGLDAYLTIKSVNDGRDYIENEEAVDAIGRIEKVIKFDDVTVPSILLSKGQKYMTSAQFNNVSIEMKAIDLHYDDASVERFHLLDAIRVISAPHGMDAWFVLTRQTINLNNPENDTITLGATEYKTMSAKNAQISAETKEQVTNSMMANAISNATARITGVAGGYVVIHQDESGQPYEILIMDNEDIALAHNVWRWNQNGLGFSSTGYNGTYGTAMTADGKIVADFIQAGIINGIKIQGSEFLVNSTVKRYASDYTQADKERCENIINGNIAPTEADYEKYDLNIDGVIDAFDLVIITRLLNGTYSEREFDASVSIHENDSMGTIRSGDTSISTKFCRSYNLVAKNGVYSNQYRTMYNNAWWKGHSGQVNFTTADGKTVTVTNGIVTLIV